MGQFNRLKIGQRLALGFGVVIAVFGVMAAFAAMRIGGLSDEIARLVGDRYQKTVVAGQIKSELNEVSRNMGNILIMTDPGQIQKELANIERVMQASEATFTSLRTLITDEAGQKQLAEIAALRDKFKPAQVAFSRLVAEDSKDEAMVKFLFAIRPVQLKYFAALDQFIAQQHAQMEEARTSAEAQARQTLFIILGVAAGAALLSLAVAWVSTHSITVPLRHAVSIAQRVAAGDLTSRVQARTQDETGQLMAALDEMNQCLQRIVGNVRQGTESIAAASAQIASGNMDLSSRTEQQAASLQQTAHSIKDLTSNVRQNAENARQADALVRSASEVARQGGAVVSQVVQTMGSIDASSKRIGDIIGVIDGIAFQTNILALNAAVEAARAGEHGRGFAVVAGEVRTLAQRSAGAAKEIRSLISDSVQKVAQGSQLVAQAGTTMEEVVASVGRVTHIMSEISAASQEQSAGIEGLSRTIDQMDGSTQQNAALVEQAAAAAESLRHQSATLEQTVSLFKLDA
ncbi:methyl-accepting chemotaxis protein [Ideonella sp.]|uniref:methyl-accepting chemotaxis protein n=1 Tax=Ideonella sp. TaxID=1929293 RepID=UPI0035B315EA